MRGRENADPKWSENKIEEEDSVRKVNCLRGRLLAERVASRNAREEAEQLGNKLLELENLLKAEAKSRNRAEKKLRLMVKRLESMNISYVNLPRLNNQESEPGSYENPTSTMSLENSDQNVQENDTLEDSSTSACQKTELVDEQRDLADHGVESSTEEGIHNSMALIAVDTAPENRTVDPEVLDETVKEVLEALRRAKEQLLSSMERKRMSMIIKVG